ncbi:MAG: CBS domain-containing protein, partial [Proteobacteria bacterium]|nr:CBS domain-containing protein [Pseudomonadota bacterium]
NNKIKPIKVAKDFMAAPVKTMQTDESVEKAGELLTRYNINVLPVMNRHKLVGLISRQVVEKASFHGLKNVAVAEYMTSEFTTVKPDTQLSIIQRSIIENNQRFLPVVNGGKLVGAITRTDLLRVLHVDATADTEPPTHTTRKRTVHLLLKERLAKPVVLLLRDIGNVADSLGYNVFAVGGFVRDVFLRLENYDIDIVVEGDGIRFARKFAARYGCEIKIHRRFGTAVMFLKNGSKVDVASARLEYYEHPAAPPKVEWSSIKLDLYRRDFTINTLAIQLNKSCWGNLIDFFGATRDIKEKFIRVLHNLSFVEDPSRIFRAIRFEQRFSFRLSKLTKSLIENAVKMNFLNNLTGKRISTELLLILKEDKVLSTLKRISELGLLTCIHPSIQYDSRLKSLLKNIKDVLSWFDLLFLDDQCEEWVVYFLGLIDHLTVDETSSLCARFHINKKDSLKIAAAKTQGHAVLQWMLSKRSFKNSELYRNLNAQPVEVCLYLMAKTNQKSVKKAFSLYFTHLQNTSIHVSGNDLVRLGIQPGKIYKQILTDLLEAVLNKEVSGRKGEIEYIKKKYAREVA